MKTGWIFPAFISEYIGNEDHILRSLSSEFDGLLHQASRIIGEDLSNFDIERNNFMNQEVLNQYISYVFSCSVTGILKRENLKPEYLSGLSMGIYAALFAGESLTFDDGLKCIKQAYHSSIAHLKDYDFGMGAVIGLTHGELQQISRSVSNRVEIVNTNGKHSFVISGIYDEVKEVAEKAQKEGAFHSGLMDVSCPYHSRFMTNTANDFRGFVSGLDIRTSKIPLISVIDQSVFQEREEIINELCRNLDSEINWYETMKRMIQLKMDVLIECGAGRSLYKIGRFIEGDFSIIPLNKLKKYLADFDKNNN
jgi:malonyl CoA-acyl carrier protein transacylase